MFHLSGLYFEAWQIHYGFEFVSIILVTKSGSMAATGWSVLHWNAKFSSCRRMPQWSGLENWVQMKWRFWFDAKGYSIKKDAILIKFIVIFNVTCFYQRLGDMYYFPNLVCIKDDFEQWSTLFLSINPAVTLFIYFFCFLCFWYGAEWILYRACNLPWVKPRLLHTKLCIAVFVLATLS